MALHLSSLLYLQVQQKSCFVALLASLITEDEAATSLANAAQFKFSGSFSDHASTTCIEPRKRSFDDYHEAAPSSPNKRYECRFCPMKFNKSQALGGHMNRHRKERENEQWNKASHLVLEQGFSKEVSSIMHHTSSSPPYQTCRQLQPKPEPIYDCDAVRLSMPMVKAISARQPCSYASSTLPVNPLETVFMVVGQQNPENVMPLNQIAPTIDYESDIPLPQGPHSTTNDELAGKMQGSIRGQNMCGGLAGSGLGYTNWNVEDPACQLNSMGLVDYHAGLQSNAAHGLISDISELVPFAERLNQYGLSSSSTPAQRPKMISTFNVADEPDLNGTATSRLMENLPWMQLESPKTGTITTLNPCSDEDFCLGDLSCQSVTMKGGQDQFMADEMEALSKLPKKENYLRERISGKVIVSDAPKMNFGVDCENLDRKKGNG